MFLNMYLNGRLIDSVQINQKLLEKIRILQLKLEEKHSDIIDTSNSEPVYFVDGIPSRMDMELPVKKTIIYN